MRLDNYWCQYTYRNVGTRRQRISIYSRKSKDGKVRWQIATGRKAEASLWFFALENALEYVDNRWPK